MLLRACLLSLCLSRAILCFPCTVFNTYCLLIHNATVTMVPRMCFPPIFPARLLRVWTDTVTFKHMCAVGRSPVGRAPSASEARPRHRRLAGCGLSCLSQGCQRKPLGTGTQSPHLTNRDSDRCTLPGSRGLNGIVPAKHSAEAWQSGHTRLVQGSLEKLLSWLRK